MVCKSRADLESACADRQRQREQQLDKLDAHLVRYAKETDVWQQIRALSFEQLRVALQSGEHSCSTVLRAYQRATIDAHTETNCVTLMVDDATSIAQNLDDEYSSGEKTKPPLFGLPFSVKEQMEMAGLDCTFGYAHRVDAPIMERDAAAILTLRQLGAVPFVRTNTPQGLVSFNCSNPVYGVTTHPLNKERTPGGSSGGEAALLAMHAAPFGIGTDGGGSIRIPSAFSGLYGIKPTMCRVSQLGVGTNLPGSVINGVTWGPMGHDVDTLASILRHTLSSDVMSTEDPYYARVPFNDEVYKNEKKLRIGWYTTDGWCTPVPAMVRAVEEMKMKLEADGHTLVPWTPPNMEHATQLFTRLFIPDGGAELCRWMNRDLVDPNMSQFVATLGLPHWILRFMAFMAKPLFPRLAVLAGSPTSTSDGLVHTFADVRKYRTQMMSEWRDLRLDVVLCPAFGHPAPTHKFPDQVSIGAMYTALYNLVDFVAGNVPVTTVTADDEKATKETYPQVDMWDKHIRTEFSEDTVGLPVGVQCVALPMQEEKCLAFMKVVEKLSKQ